MAMSIDDKLGVNKFNADMSWSHIDVDKQHPNKEEVRKVVLACPAHLYRLDDDGVTIKFNHEGCLECGTCRVVSGGKVVKEWEHPQGGKGVQFRKG